jgi:UDP-N-acetylglucosamine:LPS N-acetylglucosamine transferase
LKIIYYITEHGLGHSSRSVAIIRELIKHETKIIIRSNDEYDFLKKSFPKLKIIKGKTDFGPVMSKNGISFDLKKTERKISTWLKNLPKLIEKEEKLLRKEKPDVIISDISIMPLIAAEKCEIKSVIISSFIWNETLSMNKKTKEFFKKCYQNTDLKIKLPFGSPMKLKNIIEIGLVAKRITSKKNEVRRKLGITSRKKLVVLAISGIKKQITVNHNENIQLLDISNYSNLKKIKKKIDLVEGQNIINAADLVICKCGYGFISEILSTGTPFRYVFDSNHKEAAFIHKNLLKRGLKNRLSITSIKSIKIDSNFISNSDSQKIDTVNNKIAKKILQLSKK